MQLDTSLDTSPPRSDSALQLGWWSHPALLLIWGLLLVAAPAVPVYPVASQESPADVRFQQGLDDRQLGSRDDRSSAIEHFEAAADLYQRQGDQLGEARALAQIGNVHRSLGAPATAVEFLERARDLFAQLDSIAGWAEVEIDLGHARLRLGQTNEAEGHYRHALELWRRADEAHERDRGQAMALTGLGGVQEERGQLRAAVETYQQALELRRRAGDRAGEAVTLSNLAIVQRELGDLPATITSLQSAIVIARERGKASHVAIYQFNLAAAHQALGELQPALDGYLDVLPQARKLGERQLEQRTLASLADVYRDLGESELALDIVRTALELARASEARSEEAWLHLTLGWVFDDLDRSAEARQAFERALQLSRQLDIRSAELRSLRGLARCLRRTGDPEAALATLEEALALSRRHGYPLAEADHLREAGELQLSLKRPAEARWLLRQALDRVVDLEDPIREATTRSDLARAERALGQLDAARLQLERALALYDELRGAVVEPELRASFRAGRFGDHERYLDLLLELDRRDTTGTKTVPWRQRALEFLERARARGLAENLDTRSQADRDDVVPALDLEGIRRLLDRDTVLLTYALGRQRSWLFVVTQDALDVHELPASDRLTGSVHQFRTAAAQPGRRLRSRLQQASRDLYHHLLAPAAPRLSNHGRLLIVPDGALHHLPFSALLASDGEPLVERWSVSTIASASVLASLRRQRGSQSARSTIDQPKFVGIAQGLEAPISPLTLPGSWSALPGAEREVQNIADLLAPLDSEIFSGTRASEEIFEHSPAVRQAEWLHIAAHGRFEDPDPTTAGLILGAAPGSEDDGVLRLDEIADLDLNASLVVLSACDTGLGELQRGEGLLGLSRAFFHAGASSLLVSLWPVADDASSELMRHFYQELANGASPALALASAQRRLRADARYDHPFYWAAFVLLGDA